MFFINVCEYILSFPHTKERKKKKKKCIYIALLSLSRFFFFLVGESIYCLAWESPADLFGAALDQ